MHPLWRLTVGPCLVDGLVDQIRRTRRLSHAPAPIGQIAAVLLKLQLDCYSILPTACIALIRHAAFHTMLRQRLGLPAYVFLPSLQTMLFAPMYHDNVQHVSVNPYRIFLNK